MTAAHASPNTGTQDNAAFPRTPEARHQAGGAKPQRGDRRSVVMNGSRLQMEHDGQRWWITSVSAAN